MPKETAEVKRSEPDYSIGHGGHVVVLRGLGKSTFLVLGNRWINVSRIEEIGVHDGYCTIKLMGGNPIDFTCDSKELNDLLEHGYED